MGQQFAGDSEQMDALEVQKRGRNESAGSILLKLCEIFPFENI